MARYHINLEGNAGVCNARKNCPFGGDMVKDHYDSAEEARRSYELQNAPRPLELSVEGAFLLREVGPRQLPNRAWATLRRALDDNIFDEHDVELAITVVGEEWEKLYPSLNKKVYQWGAEERAAANTIGKLAELGKYLTERADARQQERLMILDGEFRGNK